MALKYTAAVKKVLFKQAFSYDKLVLELGEMAGIYL